MYNLTEINGISISLKNIHLVRPVSEDAKAKKFRFAVEWKEFLKNEDGDYTIEYPSEIFTFSTEQEATKARDHLIKDWNDYLEYKK
ncbi:hypothetical protein [Leptospira levettii]|uniref:hypothetical protein n=1 Tax=Leptospira levettii TaxID=2023178 RepID=UPI003EBF5792